MSRPVSRSLIGSFVLGSVVLLVAAVVLFGSRTWFTKVDRNVLFFQGSVKGLRVGAPVMFRGVEIGQVTDIALRVNPADLTGYVPVYIEVYQDKVMPVGERRAGNEAFLQALIQKGLRAQFQPQSLLTGQLMINLDFYPETPASLVGLEHRYPEIPTIPSDLEKLTRRFEQIPLEEIADKLNQTLTSVNRLLDSPDLQASLVSVNRLLQNGNTFLANLNTQLPALGADVHQTTAAATAALAQAEKTMRLDEGQPGQLAASLRETLAVAQSTLKETQAAVQNVNGIAAQNADLGYEVGRALEQITNLSRSMRDLADYLDRHPESLLRGKKNDDKK